MGDSGRRRWSEGAGVVSDTYLVRRFFNGTLSSAVFGRNKELILCTKYYMCVCRSLVSEARGLQRPYQWRGGWV